MSVNIEETFELLFGKISWLRQEIAETSEKIFISTDFPDEYANSESRRKYPVIMCISSYRSLISCTTDLWIWRRRHL